MKIHAPVWVYQVEHLDTTKRGYYAAGPDNQLFYPFFVPSSTDHEHLYLTRKTEDSPLFGEHEDQPLQIYDHITLSPHEPGTPDTTSALERSIYENYKYGREVIDLACFDTNAWMDVWQSQTNNSPRAQHLIERTRSYLARSDDISDSLLTQAQNSLRKEAYNSQAFYKALDKKFSEQPDPDTL